MVLLILHSLTAISTYVSKTMYTKWQVWMIDQWVLDHDLLYCGNHHLYCGCAASLDHIRYSKSKYVKLYVSSWLQLSGLLSRVKTCVRAVHLKARKPASKQITWPLYRKCLFQTVASIWPSTLICAFYRNQILISPCLPGCVAGHLMQIEKSNLSSKFFLYEKRSIT